MRPVRALACVLVLLVSTGPLAFADDWGLEAYSSQKSTWAGFGVGTSVHTRTKSTTKMPHLAEPQQTVTEERKTLLRVTEEGFVVKVETMYGGDWMTREETEPRVSPETTRPQITDAGTGTMEIEGTSYTCAKKKVTMTEEGESQQMVLWVHDQHGVLRMEPGAGQGSWAVTRLNVPFQVGDVTLTCRELTVSMGMPGAASTMLMSASVPGRVVRVESAFKQQGTESTTLTELVGFTKK